MKIMRKRILSVVLSLVMTATMLVALPTTAHADPIPINITSTDSGATLSGATSGGAIATNNRWDYYPGTHTLILSDAGPYTLHGTNDDLAIVVDGGATNATIILNGVNITTSITTDRPTLRVMANCTITLQGSSSNLFDNKHSEGIIIDVGKNCTINGSGSLSIKADSLSSIASGIGMNSISTLSISGTASVHTECVTVGNGCGIGAFSGVTINVASGAALSAKGRVGISNFTVTGGPSLNVNGTMDIEGTGSGVVIYSAGAGYFFDGSGTITLKGATGSRVFATEIPTINMGDNITLVINSRDTSARTVNFTKSSAATTHLWKLTGATFVSPSVAADASVNISIPVGASKIQRAIPVCEIGATKYTSVLDAIAAVPTGGATPTTIRLLVDITQPLPELYQIINKRITFDLNDFDLIFTSNALHIDNGSIVDYTGNGEFKVVYEVTSNVNGPIVYWAVAVGAYGAAGSSSITLTGVEIIDRGSGTDRYVWGVYVEKGGTATVNGDVKATSISGSSNVADGVHFGLHGASYGTITVNGDVISSEYGAFFDSGLANVSTLTVTGTILAEGYGVFVNKGDVDINGTIEAEKDGIVACPAAKVLFTGDITAGNTYSGIAASGTDAEVTMIGSIKAFFGMYVVDEAMVTFTGNIEADAAGVFAETDVTVTVNGNITSGSDGVYAQQGSTVTVTGDIDADQEGVYAYSGSVVTVTGNITARNFSGVRAFGTGTEVTVTGSIEAILGVYAFTGAKVTVTGDIDALYQGILVDNNDGVEVNIYGNITAGYIGVEAWGESVVNVDGNIVVTQVDEEHLNCGVVAAMGAKVTVDGTITAPNYVAFYILGTDPQEFYYVLATDNTTPSLKGDYRQYDDEGAYDMLTSYVWVKAPVTPKTGDSTTLWLLFGALLVAALGTGCVLAYRKREQQV